VKSRFQEIAEGIGDLVTKKNAAYGSSFAKSGAFLRLLYPEGIAPAQFDDALLLVRIFDKLQRIATDRDALGESPYRDIAGYGVLGAALHGGKVGPELQAAMSARRVRKQGKAQSGPVLQRPLPHGGSSRRQRPQTRLLPKVRVQAQKAGKATGNVTGNSLRE